VIAGRERAGRPVFRDRRWGVYVTFQAPDAYSARCFGEYGLVTDDSGTISAMYKPYHLIGMELGLFVASAALRGEPTGAPDGFRGDVAAVTKRTLKRGEVLDGEGGYTVFGKLMPAAQSLAVGAVPMGLAHGLPVLRAVAAGQAVTWADVDASALTGLAADALAFRREMEATFGAEVSKAAAE